MADFDIGAILNSLSPDDIENIKNVASSFLGSQDGTNEKQKEEKKERQPAIPNINDLSSLGMPDLSQLTALLPIFQAINSPDDRLDFIQALKPLLSDEKKQKADEAMKLVRLMSVIPLLRERGLM